jgi:hypothetical protein
VAKSRIREFVTPKAASRARPVTRIGAHLPESYFRETEDAFSRAVANAGGRREFFFELAGIKFCLQSAGETLLPRITGTLAHLEVWDDAPVDFTICCWDDNATMAELPMPTRWMLNQAAFCNIGSLTNQRFRTFYVDWLRNLSCIDLESNIAYCCYEDAEPLLMCEVSGPFRAIFNTILNRKGMQLVHASAVGTSRGTVIFAGPPGSGKSTLSVLCLREGLLYQSDDLCILSAGEQPRSLSLYNIAKLREDSLPRFESLRPILSHFQEDDEKKAYFYVHQHFPSQLLKEAPVRALVLPRINHESVSRLERASPVEAMRAVIPWTIKEIPKSDTLGDKIMLQALARLPSHHLILGQDDRQNLDLIRRLLDDA